MNEFYERIMHREQTALWQAVTVIGGENIGEKALLRDQKIVWTSEPGGFLERHKQELEREGLDGCVKLGDTPVFMENVGSESRIVICGAGHVAEAVLKISRILEMPVTVIEDRKEFADEARKSGADRVICAPFGEALHQLQTSPETYFIVMTRGHIWDMECLREIVKKPNAYIGMMGSHRRSAMVKEKLAEEGVSREALDEIHAPIGLPIGAETESEIAVSVMAEIIQVRNSHGRNFGYPKLLLEAISNCGGHGRMILAMIVRRKGSAPRMPGTKMLFMEDGTEEGTIGGGSLEADARRRAAQLFQKEKIMPEIFHTDLASDAAAKEGMVCGGQVDIYMEEVLPG
ncbi:MAG: XdhC family protein [Lachnospiraceae bacterium]|nr:XdhC family protein [Lachnospiraceae bacterium]